MRLSLRRSGAAVDTGEDERLLQLALRAELLELPRQEVRVLRFGYVEHDDVTYRVVTGEVDDPRYSPAIAFFRTDGGIVFLERAR